MSPCKACDQEEPVSRTFRVQEAEILIGRAGGVDNPVRRSGGSRIRAGHGRAPGATPGAGRGPPRAGLARRLRRAPTSRFRPSCWPSASRGESVSLQPRRPLFLDPRTPAGIPAGREGGRAAERVHGAPRGGAGATRRPPPQGEPPGGSPSFCAGPESAGAVRLASRREETGESYPTAGPPKRGSSNAAPGVHRHTRGNPVA